VLARGPSLSRFVAVRRNVESAWLQCGRDSGSDGAQIGLERSGGKGCEKKICCDTVMTGVECAAFEGLDRAVAGTEVSA
jgi:hypothetical protein